VLLPEFQLRARVLYNGSVDLPNFSFTRCSRRFAAPRHYHLSSRNGRSYKGDRHPDRYDLSVEDEGEQDTMFEETERECGNCGEIKLCMTKEGIREEVQAALMGW
jgi:hypothetical protein